MSKDKLGTLTARLGLVDEWADTSTPTAHPGSARPVTPPYSGTGRPPLSKYPNLARSVKALAIEVGKAAARPVSRREGSRPGKGRRGLKRMYSRFVALRIRPAEDGPVQFWLSDLPAGTALTTLVRMAKLRRCIEHDDREMKQALGLVNFEGRTFISPSAVAFRNRPGFRNPSSCLTWCLQGRNLRGTRESALTTLATSDRGLACQSNIPPRHTL
ncbi:hypothetical protein ACEZCY_17565 [Streptacidiphilus sp. N1-12]|uniref:Transposase n=2 Tax=Streptacidiphilus alkalitolerans TaxID=3342712 RepID=A0ABV6VCB5_9ACTN